MINPQPKPPQGKLLPKKAKERDPLELLKDKVWKVFSRYIRLRDCLKTTGTIYRAVCYSCGKEFYFSDLNAGHYIPRKWNNTFLDETNVHAQCVGCNKYKDGNIGDYTITLQNEYGMDYNQKLYIKSRQEKKFTKEELESLLVYYKSKIKELEE